MRRAHRIEIRFEYSIAFTLLLPQSQIRPVIIRLRILPSSPARIPWPGDVTVLKKLPDVEIGVKL